MSEDIDIVVLLRVACDCLYGDLCVHAAAADEIVRLRAERDHAQVQANHLADRLIKEARRG